MWPLLDYLFVQYPLAILIMSIVTYLIYYGYTIYLLNIKSLFIKIIGLTIGLIGVIFYLLSELRYLSYSIIYIGLVIMLYPLNKFRFGLSLIIIGITINLLYHNFLIDVFLIGCGVALVKST